jgi:hypothetical protein
MIVMMMTKWRGGEEKWILESACNLVCSLQLFKQDLDKMEENDHNEKHNGAVSSNCSPEEHKSNVYFVIQ